MLITGLSETDTLLLLLQALLDRQRTLAVQIAEVTAKLNGDPKAPAKPAPAAPAKPLAKAASKPVKPASAPARTPISAAGRKAIADAQRARWAQVRKDQAKGKKEPKTPGQRLNLAVAGD